MELEEIKRSLNKISNDEYAKLISLARKFSKLNIEGEKTRIAVVGSYSTQILVSVFRLLLIKNNIIAEIYEADYNSLNSELLDSNSKLYKFKPNFLIILPHYRDVYDFPDLLDMTENINASVNLIVNKYLNVWEKAHNHLPNCNIIQSNYVIPTERELGLLEENVFYSKRNFYRLINTEITKSHKTYVSIIDLDELASYEGKKNWFDESAYYLNKSGFAMKYVGEVADLLAKDIFLEKGIGRKCLVLDLDNTLWGGVVADEGYDEVDLNPTSPIGEAYISFQKYVLQLKKRGVILAVCSKNDIDIAKEPFLKNKNMILKMEDIACFVANWEDKASNLKYIADTIGIGIDSLVFFDDNPVERQIVTQFLPEVKVIEVPIDPAYYIRALDRSNAFDVLQLTKEDIDRNETYQVKNKLKNLENSFVDYDSYLKSLDMKFTCKNVNSKNCNRFTQLTNKSNQFNLCTNRYSEGQIQELLSDSSYKLLTLELDDKFMNYGEIAAIILKIEDEVCFVENFVMSCRVLKRGVENVAIQRIVQIANTYKCKKIIGEYKETKKNKMVEYFYSDLGFDILKSTEESKSYIWNLDAKMELDYFGVVLEEI